MPTLVFMICVVRQEIVWKSWVETGLDIGTFGSMTNGVCVTGLRSTTALEIQERRIQKLENDKLKFKYWVMGVAGALTLGMSIFKEDVLKMFH